MTHHSATKTYSLEKIKQQFSSINGLRMTGAARQGIVSLGFSLEDVVDAIQSLEDSDFYKSMSPNNPNFVCWQDVYKSSFKGTDLYIKFQQARDNTFYMLLSFKEK